MKLLAQRGFECRAFCAAKLDLEADERFEQILADTGLRSGIHNIAVGNRSVRLRHVLMGDIPVGVFHTRSARIDQWSPGEAEGMLAAFERVTGDFRPDVLLTYGSDPVTRTMIRLAEQRGIQVVFALHNFAYHDASMFRELHHVVVPSEFSRAWYRKRLRVECRVLPYAIDWTRVSVSGGRRAESGEPEATPHPDPLPTDGEREFSSDAQRSTLNAQRFVTFVNPQPAKGVFVFARIAEQLQRRRPDIPILVVEGRGPLSWLERTEIDLSWATNLHAMANTFDPRDFYAVTKLLLVPSLWNESFGLVAAEAMINGIPVLASSRGALPETVADAGFLFDIPAQYTPETTSVPTAEEVEPWVETIIRLWDDEKLYRECSRKAIAYAQRWHPDRLGPIYAEFFRNLQPQPGPPIVPRRSQWKS